MSGQEAGVTSEPAGDGAPATGSEETPRFRYSAEIAAEIEQRWQRRWEELGTFHTPK